MTKPKLTFLLLFISLNFIVAQQAAEKEVPTPVIKRAENYMSILQKHYAEGEYQLHKDYSDSLLQVAKNHGLTKMHVLALVNQAVYFNNRNERLKAIELYYEALEQCKKIPEDFRAKTVVLVNMANTYNNIGSYNKAIAAMKEVLVVTDSTANSDMVKAAALVGLANNYAELENYEKTLEYANRAKKIGEKTNNEAILVPSVNSIIDALINTNKFEEALTICEKALKLPSLEKPTKARGWLLLNTGIVNYHLENLDTSLNYLKTCIALAEEKELFEIQMYGHEYLSKVYEQKKDYQASHTAQKEYSLLREKFLKDTKDASNADLKKDISLKDETIVESKEELLALSSKGKTLTIWGAALLILLMVLLFVYIRRKKKIELAQAKLQSQYQNLKQEISDEENNSLSVQSETSLSKDADVKPYKNSSLTPEKREAFKKKILAFMNEEKPFLNPDLSQSDFAANIGISSHHFSEVLHYGFEQNFYNLINSYRVLEAQKLMKEKKYTDAKIIAIAFDSGFKSKTSFNRVFKKYSGQTPSEFRANL
ncbi:MAG: helix-turn-helix domain-containing protein [Maribacter sp.]